MSTEGEDDLVEHGLPMFSQICFFSGVFFGERNSLLSTLCLLFLAKQVRKEQDYSARVIGSGTFASITAFSHQGCLLLCYDRSKREVKQVGYRIFV